MTRKRSTSRLLAIAAIAFGGLSAAHGSVNADTFQAIPGPITVSSVTFVYPLVNPSLESGEEGFGVRDTTVQPAYPTSTKLYSVTAEVTAQAFVSDWAYIKLCLYNDSQYEFSPTDGVDATVYGGVSPVGCGNAAADLSDALSHAMEIVWTRGANIAGSTFGLTAHVGGNSYVLDNSSNVVLSGPTNTYAGDGRTFENSLGIRINFNFNVSHAIAAGTIWKALVAAQYTTAKLDGIEAPNTKPGIGAAESTAVTVATFAQMITGYTPANPAAEPAVAFDPGTGAASAATSGQDFGMIDPGGSSTAVAVNPGSWVSNTNHRLSLSATDFTAQPAGQALDTLTLKVDGDAILDEGAIIGYAAPASKHVALDCKSNDVTKTLVRVLKTASTVQLPNTFVGTGEQPVNTAGKTYTPVTTLTCTLLYGGGAKYAFTVYTATVTASVGAYVPPES